MLTKKEKKAAKINARKLSDDFLSSTITHQFVGLKANKGIDGLGKRLVKRASTLMHIHIKEEWLRKGRPVTEYFAGKTIKLTNGISLKKYKKYKLRKLEEEYSKSCSGAYVL